MYFAAIGLHVLAGCAYGKIAGEGPFEDAGVIHADGGAKDAKTPPKDAQAVEDVSQELPDVTTTTTCDPLPLGTGLATCDTCLGASCCSEDQACGNDQACLAFIGCMDNCIPTDGGPPDQQCYSDCQTTYPNGANELDMLDTCMQTSCMTDCQ